jgi:NTP pyrophosphatase (non-canonical NTP hydrolase)
MDLTFKHYSNKAREFAIYNKDMGAFYSVLGLCGESGEVADKLKKIYRDKNGVISDNDTKEIAYELGDVLWYLSNIATDLGLTLDDIAKLNLTKLYKRRENNTLHGEGDNR